MGRLHTEGRRAACVPSLPHTINVGERSFSFDGCPQPLRPLLYDLMRFERPLITWDLFNAAPPAEFRAPGALRLPGPADAPTAAVPGPVATQLAITSRPNSREAAPPGANAVPPPLAAGSVSNLPSAQGTQLPLANPGAAMTGASTATLDAKSSAALSQHPSAAAPCDAAPSSSKPSSKPLRDPFEVNAVTHGGFTTSEVKRRGVELDFEEWTSSFPGPYDGSEIFASRVTILSQ